MGAFGDEDPEGPGTGLRQFYQVANAVHEYKRVNLRSSARTESPARLVITNAQYGGTCKKHLGAKSILRVDQCSLFLLKRRFWH